MKGWRQEDINRINARNECKYQIIIGIDTGVKTGFATWDPINRNFIGIETLAIHKALEFVKILFRNYNGKIFVRVEDARQRKWFGNGAEACEKAMAKMQGAGSVKRDATIWEDALKDWNIPFEMVNPDANKTKLDAQAFEQLTGWNKITSNHARDAGMLVYQYR